LFDTAHDYPNSENLLGKALKKVRKNVYITTKLIKRDKKGFLSDLDESLKRLGTDYIDIFLFHAVSKDSEYKDKEKSGVLMLL
jgi:predicted aldo/keto reductase-like oxidoreductase